MDTKLIDQALIGIIAKRAELDQLTYDHKDYDKVEDDLHELEDEFNDQYGDSFEEILDTIHDDLDSDSDTLLPTAYLAKKYQVSKTTEGKNAFDVSFKEGVFLESKKYPAQDLRLVLLPSPTRFVLLVSGKKKEILWQAAQ